jgi:hypothetical protein
MSIFSFGVMVLFIGSVRNSCGNKNNSGNGHTFSPKNRKELQRPKLNPMYVMFILLRFGTKPLQSNPTLPIPFVWANLSCKPLCLWLHFLVAATKILVKPLFPLWFLNLRSVLRVLITSLAATFKIQILLARP